jgi:membrane-associated phospholipid phosphatase
MSNTRCHRRSCLLVLALLASATPCMAQFAGSSRASHSACGETPVPSVGGLFTGTLQGFRQVPSTGSLGLLALGGAAALSVHPVDRSVTRALEDPSPLHDTFSMGALVGSTPFQLGSAFLAYGIGRALDKPCVASVGADLVQAQLMAEVLTVAIKTATRRARAEGGGFSFPSGHTTAAFASATVLQQRFGWKVGIPAYAVASYVAAARVQTQRHYLSDVAFGAALGMVAGRSVTIGHNGRGFRVSPMAAPGGAGASFTWVDK